MGGGCAGPVGGEARQATLPVGVGQRGASRPDSRAPGPGSSRCLVTIHPARAKLCHAHGIQAADVRMGLEQSFVTQTTERKAGLRPPPGGKVAVTRIGTKVFVGVRWFEQRHPLPVNPSLGTRAAFAVIRGPFLVGIAPGDVHALLAQPGPHLAVQDQSLVGRGQPVECLGVLPGPPPGCGAARRHARQQDANGDSVKKGAHGEGKTHPKESVCTMSTLFHDPR